MYFMVNTAFVNYLDQFPNLMESLEFPIIKKKTTFEQTLLISLNVSKFDSDLLNEHRNLKDFIHQYDCKKEIFDLKERHDTTDLTTNKNFFSNNYIVGNFSVHYCSNLSTGYNFGNISIMQTQETQEVGSQPCLTASKGSRCSNTEINQYWMQNYDLYKFGINSFWSSDGCYSALQKIKTVQRMHIL